MPFNPTKSTWPQVANEQAAGEMTAGNLNSTTTVAYTHLRAHETL